MDKIKAHSLIESKAHTLTPLSTLFIFSPGVATRYVAGQLTNRSLFSHREPGPVF